MKRVAAFIILLAAVTPASTAQQETATLVEPADLARREDLVGKLIVVDDHIRFFQNHPRVGYDELYLRRTSVPFRLPPPLRPETPPRNQVAIVQGRLTREGSRLYVDATAIDLQPSDLERFEKAVASFPARDFQARREWSRWAAKRAKAFGDDDLAARARVVEADALRIEAEMRRLGVDAPQEWLSLAQQGRKRGVAEPEPSALAHRAFRAMLAGAATPAVLGTLKDEVERFFPLASGDAAAGGVDLGSWGAKYDEDPASAYRSAPAELRKPLDRRLWGDVVQKLLETRAAEDVQAALKMVDETTSLLPERPDLATKMIAQAQARARQDLASLRIADLKAVGELLKRRAGDRGADLNLYRDWLKARRDRLSDTDAEGPVTLAGQYESLLNDSETARQLLERAWKIAPGSAPVADAFRLRGYRRVGEDWVKDEPIAAAPVPAGGRPSSPEQGLKNMTPAEVEAVMGVEPTSKTVVATRGRIMLQWIFAETRHKRYVNFVYVPGSREPRVASDFLLPRQDLR